MSAEGGSIKLYQVTFDGEHDFIEAKSFGDAVRLWLKEMKRQDPEDWDDGEEPEQVVLVSDKPVVREYSEVGNY